MEAFLEDRDFVIDKDLVKGIEALAIFADVAFAGWCGCDKLEKQVADDFCFLAKDFLQLVVNNVRENTKRIKKGE